jgi:hypothetical protein
MGTKNDPGAYDCYAKAEPDEPLFVLLARDPHAPELVRRWAELRALEIGPDGPREKVTEAMECAIQMERWRESRLAGSPTSVADPEV